MRLCFETDTHWLWSHDGYQIGLFYLELAPSSNKSQFVQFNLVPFPYVCDHFYKIKNGTFFEITILVGWL